MASISVEEKIRRQQANASVIGTNAMEGLALDSETLELMHRFADGELTRAELSAAIDEHVAGLLAVRRTGSHTIMAEMGAAQAR